MNFVDRQNHFPIISGRGEKSPINSPITNSICFQFLRLLEFFLFFAQIFLFQFFPNLVQRINFFINSPSWTYIPFFHSTDFFLFSFTTSPTSFLSPRKSEFFCYLFLLHEKISRFLSFSRLLIDLSRLATAEKVHFRLPLDFEYFYNFLNALILLFFKQSTLWGHRAKNTTSDRVEIFRQSELYAHGDEH